MIKAFRCVALALVAGAWLGAAPGSAETLRLAHHHVVGGQLDRAAHLLADRVDEMTGGELEIQIFPAAQLGQQNEAFEQLNLGVIDMSLSPISLMDKVYPPIRVFDLPFLWDDFEHFQRAVDGEFGKAAFEGLLANSNTRLIGMSGLGFRDMIFRGEPVTEVAGMGGLKMRAPEAHLWIRMFELLGARPTPVTWGEVYTAMQTGVADGLEAPAVGALDMKFDEVTSSVVLTQHMFGNMGVCINQQRYEQLSPEFQEAITVAGAEAGRYMTEDTIAGVAKAYEDMKARGLVVVEPEDRAEWAEAMKPLWKEVAAQHPDSAHLIELALAAK
jgi:TRAP-type transport system periplasmic protein